MATLQTIRSKGPLLVVVIGLALFAFIGDHLGYRLNLQSESKVEAKGGNLEYDLTITNTCIGYLVGDYSGYLECLKYPVL